MPPLPEKPGSAVVWTGVSRAALRVLVGRGHVLCPPHNGDEEQVPPASCLGLPSPLCSSNGVWQARVPLHC